MGRHFLTQGRPGVRVRNVHGKSGPKIYVYAVFSSLSSDFEKGGAQKGTPGVCKDSLEPRVSWAEPEGWA